MGVSMICDAFSQAIVGNLAPLAGPKVAEAVRQAISELYAVWARAVSAGFSKYTTPDGSLPPRLGEPAQSALYPSTAKSGTKRGMGASTRCMEIRRVSASVR